MAIIVSRFHRSKVTGQKIGNVEGASWGVMEKMRPKTSAAPLYHKPQQDKKPESRPGALTID